MLRIFSSPPVITIIITDIILGSEILSVKDKLSPLAPRRLTLPQFSLNLMNDIGAYQAKGSRQRIKLEHYSSISPEKRISSLEEGISSLPEGEWTGAELQWAMTQDKAKLVWQNCNALKNGHLPKWVGADSQRRWRRRKQELWLRGINILSGLIWLKQYIKKDCQQARDIFVKCVMSKKINVVLLLLLILRND